MVERASVITTREELLCAIQSYAEEWKACGGLETLDLSEAKDDVISAIEAHEAFIDRRARGG